MTDDTKYAVAFHRIPGIGRARIKLMRERFGSLGAAWGVSASGLRDAGLDGKTVGHIVEARPGISPDEEVANLERAGITVIVPEDGPDDRPDDRPDAAAYPRLLREIYDPPAVLYVRGTLLEEDESALTVVGTRRVTSYGREVTMRLVGDLSSHGVAIVSGLARGVDALAHEAALSAGGRTLAVMACGLDMVYPTSHTSLARRIVEQGAILSDYPLGTKPKPENFPRRNRILAGLTMGTLVVEAPDRSGALITARYAMEEGRDVFAVPGSILSPAGKGTNRLIQDGAKLVMGYEEILEEMHIGTAPRQLTMAPVLVEDETEAALLRLLSQEPTHIDELRRDMGLPMADVSSTLAMMELKGMVRQSGAMTYVFSGEATVD